MSMGLSDCMVTGQYNVGVPGLSSDPFPCTPLISWKAQGDSTLKTPSVEFITDGHELEQAYSSLTAVFVEWSQVNQSPSVWSGPRPRSWL